MKNKVEKLIDGTKTLIIVTDNGVGLQGKKGDIMALFGVLINYLVHEVDVNEDLLRECVEVGIKNETSKDKEDKKDELDTCLEEAKGLVEKLSSDSKDRKTFDKVLKHMEEINKIIKEI